MRSAFMHFIYQAWINSGFAQHHCGTMRGIQLKAKLLQLDGQIDNALLVTFAHRQQRAARFFHGGLCTEHRFGKGFRKGTANAHHFTG